jgi:hypothetical protein
MGGLQRRQDRALPTTPAREYTKEAARLLRHAMQTEPGRRRDADAPAYPHAPTRVAGARPQGTGAGERAVAAAGAGISIRI